MADELTSEPIPATPAPPPSAVTVLTGTISERETDLQSQIDVLKAERDGERGSKVKLEKDIAYLQDKLAKLQDPTTKTPPADDRSELEKFMDGE